MDVAFEMMDALKSPVLTHSSEWVPSIPKRILDLIPQARLLSKLKKEEMATLPEVAVFIMTRSTVAPMDSDWVDIYTHVGCTVEETYFNRSAWDSIQAPKLLSRYQTEMLNKLRIWIYEKRRIYLKQKLKENKEPVKIIAPTPQLKAGAEYTQLNLF